MKLILTIKNQKDIRLEFKEGRKTIDVEDLTISRNLDTLLIRAIDKLLLRNRIDRLSLKSLEIRGKMDVQTVSSMVMNAIRSGVGV